MRLIAIVLFGLTLFTTSTAAQADCRDEALAASRKGIHHLVVSFEGLASYSAGFVRKGLIAPLIAAHPGRFVSANFAYTSVTRAELCIREWSSVHGQSLRLTIIGHSFGGGIATFRLFKLIPDLYISEAVTLDPRSWTSDSNLRKTRSLEQFARPVNVGQFLNFYQRGGMPGYRVEGAENFELTGVRHTRVPRHEAVRAALTDLLLY